LELFEIDSFSNEKQSKYSKYNIRRLIQKKEENRWKRLEEISNIQ
jgi:hypothetical protein